MKRKPNHMIYPHSANTYSPSQKPVNALSVRLRQHVATTVSCQKDSSHSPCMTPTQTAYAWSDGMARSYENWGLRPNFMVGIEEGKDIQHEESLFLFIQTTLEKQKVSSSEILNRPRYVICSFKSLESGQSHCYQWERIFYFISFIWKLYQSKDINFAVNV